jgi:hypothetical protein
MANLKKQRHLGEASGALDLAAPVASAPNLRHNCCHHWIIDVAKAPLSKGVCRLCGEEKLFRNQLHWDEIVPEGVVNIRRQASGSINIAEEMGEYAPLQPLRRSGRPIALQSAG